ncbi:MAG: hypothetical protein IKP74_03220 [Clostridia bacterium]|nr:hypothetical protein [Clostridia bacterium]
METVIWLVASLALPLILLGVAIFAWTRRTPVWFYAGIPSPTVTDVRAFNRANGIAWALFSLPFFAAAGVGVVHRLAAAGIILAGCLFGIPLLVFSYHKICKKYEKTE